jgi:hypothetical protein
MRLPALLVTLLIALTACGDAQPPKGGPDSTAPKAGQEAFPAASHQVPDGFHEELCPDLRSKSSGLAIRLAVPDDYQVEVYKYRNSCRFVAELDRDFSVSMNSHESLRHYKEKWVDSNAGYEGDTGTGDIAYDAEAEVYGDRRGELLSWGSNNDGLPLDNRLMQADGVRLAWHTPRGKSRRWAEELVTVTASIGVVESQRDTCTADGDTVTYTVPRPLTDDIDNYGDYCHLYLKERESLLRYAEIDPVPRRSVEELAAALRGQRNVVSVAREPGVASLDGRPADRLTWVVVRPHRTWDGPAGTWRLITIGREDLHVTWGGTPVQWRQEEGDFDAFVESVRLSPALPSRS